MCRVGLLGVLAANLIALTPPTAHAQCTPTSSASTQTVSSFIGGTVFIDDNVDQILNGGETGLKDVTVTLKETSSPPKLQPQTRQTDKDGAYEFRSLVAGTYLVTITVPDGYVTTTGEKLEIEIKPDGTGGTCLANFGLFKKGALGSGLSFIGGTVFIDDNVDQILNGREDGKKDVTITLQLNTPNSDKKLRTKTDKDGEYEFKNLAAGVYLVTMDVPDGYVSTTGEQLEVKVDGFNGTRLANFGLFKKTSIDGSTLPSSAVSGTTASGSSGSGRSAPVAARATAVPTATAVPPTRTPTLTPLQRLATLTPIYSARFWIEGHAEDNGEVIDFAGDGSVLQPTNMDMRLAINGEVLDVVVVGQLSYRRLVTDELWSPTSLVTLRSWHGVLSPLDVIGLSRASGVVRDVYPTSDWADLDGEIVQRYEVPLGLAVPPPVAALSVSGQVSAPVGAPAGAQATPLPVATPVPAPGQLLVMDGMAELWVSPLDKLVRLAHLQMFVPSVRQERAGRLEPAAVDVWVGFEDHNAPFTINVPLALAPATPLPAAATAAARAAEGTPAAGVPTGPGASIRPVLPTALAQRPPEGTGAEPAEGPVSIADASLARSAAAERALLALASASGPRSGSRVDASGVVLDVPWRSVFDASGVVATDGPASLSMILEAFGVAAPTGDLQALADRWQETRVAGEPIRLDTLIRMAERGSLRPIGTGRGPGGGDWTAALARDFIRRGYPVLALVRPAALLDGTSDDSQPDRFIVLMGVDGTQILYHDPTLAAGATRPIDPFTLDQAWASATPPRQGVVFGFGAGVIGLLDTNPRQPAPLTARGEATLVPTVAIVAVTPTVLTEEQLARPETPAPAGGLHPIVLGFLGVLACGIGFLLARLYR